MKWVEIIGQEKAVQTLRRSLAGGKIAHAYLFHGPAGVGKKTVATTAAAALLCAAPQEGEACGNCPECRLWQRQAHPDFHFIRPSGTTIKIEQVREIQRLAGLKPFRLRRQVYLIAPAEAMTSEAANSFLKILEEPPPYVIFFLIAERLAEILPTVISRCYLIPFYPLSPGEISRGLKRLFPGLERNRLEVIAAASEGSLGRALQMAREEGESEVEELEKIVAALSEGDKHNLLRWAEKLAEDKEKAMKQIKELARWYRDLLVWQETMDSSLLHYRTLLNKIKKGAESRGDKRQILMSLEFTLQALKSLEANANTRLTLEILFLQLAIAGEGV